MVSKVPKGRVVPFYLTDEGDVLPLQFHNEEELDIIQQFVVGILGGKIPVDFNIVINDPKYKFSVYDKRKSEK